MVTGSRFEFEPVTPDDLPFLLEVRNSCRGVLHDDRSFTAVECERWFRSTQPDFHMIRHDGVPIGYFRLARHDPHRGSIEIGADLHQRFRGRGLGRGAYEVFLPTVQQRYGVSSVELRVLSHNATALGLYRALGFVEFDRTPDFAVRGGEQVDDIAMRKDL